MCMSVDFTQTRSLPLLVSAAARLAKMNPELGVQLSHLTWLLFQSELGQKMCQQLMLDVSAILAKLAQALPEESTNPDGANFYQQYQRQQFCKRFNDALERCQEPSSPAEWQNYASLMFQTLGADEAEFTRAATTAASSMVVDSKTSTPASPASQRTRCKRKASDETQSQSTTDANSAPAQMRLSSFGVNLVEKVRMGHAVVGRDSEIARMLEILARSSGYCPVLIGKAGVGKTAVVVGLAQRMACEDVSDDFPTQLWALDTNLIIKAMEDAQACEEFLKAIQEAESIAPQPIFFIDDLHEILCRVSCQKSDTPASRVVKALLLGKFRCIGATTPANHRLHFVKSSIGQRFQQLHVREASTHTTAKIIQAMRPMMESKRRVRVDDSAIKAAVTLAHDHMSDAVLPSAAIDLIVSACEIARSGKSSSTSSSSSRSSCDYFSPPPSPSHVTSVWMAEDDDVKDQSMSETGNPTPSSGPVPNVDTASKDLIRSQQSSRLIVTNISNTLMPQISSRANHLLHSSKQCAGPVESIKRRAVANADMASLTRLVATANVCDDDDSDSDCDDDGQDDGSVMDMGWDGTAVVSAIHVRAALAAMVASV